MSHFGQSRDLGTFVSGTCAGCAPVTGRNSCRSRATNCETQRGGMQPGRGGVTKEPQGRHRRAPGRLGSDTKLCAVSGLAFTNATRPPAPWGTTMMGLLRPAALKFLDGMEGLATTASPTLWLE